MSETIFPARRALIAGWPQNLARRIRQMGTSACATLREWRRRSRSRYELASFSYDERNDLAFAAEIDAEIAKPFWKK